jgi:hypothetical protein
MKNEAWPDNSIQQVNSGDMTKMKEIESVQHEFSKRLCTRSEDSKQRGKLGGYWEENSSCC